MRLQQELDSSWDDLVEKEDSKKDSYFSDSEASSPVENRRQKPKQESSRARLRIEASCSPRIEVGTHRKSSSGSEGKDKVKRRS